MPDVEEYEVESIMQAEAVKPSGSRGMRWNYLVKWKGYDIKDATLEPPESFEGSEHFIERFWSRIDTDGRDYKNISKFRLGEIFFPVGPPARRPSTKAKVPKQPEPRSGPSRSQVDSPPADKPKSRIRKRAPEIKEEIEAPNPKRQRGRSRKRNDSPGPRSSSRHTIPETPRVSRSLTKAVRKPHSTRKTASTVKASSSKRTIVSPSSSSDEMLLSPTRPEPEASTSTAGSKPERPFRYPEPSFPKNSLFGNSSVAEPSQDVTEIISFGSPKLLESRSISQKAAATYKSKSATARSTIPAHRLREANPRVKMMDTPMIIGVSDNAISTKARLFQWAKSDTAGSSGAANSKARSQAAVPRTKAGPGRSSSGMLIPDLGIVNGNGNGERRRVPQDKSGPADITKAAAGKEKEGKNGDNLEGNVDTEALEPEAKAHSPAAPPPTAGELLQMAGLDSAEANELPDFEEDETNSEVQGSAEPSTFRIAEAKTAVPTMVSEPSTSAVPVKPNTSLGSLWARSTIFGPLGVGRYAPVVPPQETIFGNQSTAPSRSVLHLVLDPAVTIPLVFKDVHAAKSALFPSFNDIVKNSAPVLPGKFYKGEHALVLVGTFKTEGSSAHVVPDADINDDQKLHVERFTARLQAGELFVAMVGTYVLAFCSAESNTLAQKLNMPSVLLGLDGSVLVTHVQIENYSAYVDASIHADDSRW